MKIMRRIAGVIFALALLLSLAACEQATERSAAASSSSASESSAAEAAEPEASAAKSAPDESAAEPSPEENEQARVLVAYFSATGNTRPIAETIAELTGGDLYEIVPAEPYTEEDLNYSNDSCRANQEQNDPSARPEISGTVENMENYDIVLIGHPIWWGEEPRIVDTFMESYDFSGKTVVNFCTSGGSGVSASTESLKALSPDASWLEGYRFETGASEDAIQGWLDSLNLF